MTKYTNEAVDVRTLADWTCCRNRRCEDCYGLQIVLVDITLYKCCTCGELCDDTFESEHDPNTIECAKCIAEREGESWYYEYQVYENDDARVDSDDGVYENVKVVVKAKAA